jgi:hypothetical protein
MGGEFYQVHERLIRGRRYGKQVAAIVDIRGNIRHDLQDLKRKQPALPGRFLLKHKPHVIQQIHEPSKEIEPTCHDFFTEEPIRGIQVSLIDFGLAFKAYVGQDPEHITYIPYSVTEMATTRSDGKGAFKNPHQRNMVPTLGADRRIISLD